MKCPHCEKEIEIENLRGELQKQGMIDKASKGELMSRRHSATISKTEN